MSKIKPELSYRKSASGKHAILIRIYSSGKNTYISTGYEVNKTDWNVKERLTRLSTPNSIALNNFIKKAVYELEGIAMDLTVMGKEPTVSAIMDKYRPKDSVDILENKNRFKKIDNLNKRSSTQNVFVTYSWEGEEHNEKIISFVDLLRKEGYNATMDTKESQEQTSTNFNQMMIQGIQNSKKVIIVLSKTYKEKADSFVGGVGFEYKIILEQLKTNKNKFIFTSFGTNDIKEIIPLGIAGIDILDLKRDQDESNFNKLHAKLQSKNIINFSPVSKTKREVKTKAIKPFTL